MAQKFKTCKSCGYDNDSYARKCNNCANDLTDYNNYHHRWVCPECGTYNMSENSSCVCGYNTGCFISTAICEIIGKDDDCDELQTLRGFRDNVLCKEPSLKAMVDEYYLISPPLADALRKMSNKHEIAEELFENHIDIILKQINQNKISETVSSYQEMISHLKSKIYF